VREQRFRVPKAMKEIINQTNLTRDEISMKKKKKKQNKEEKIRFN